MPSDTARNTAALADDQPRRLPVAVGLTVAAGASLSLWSVIALGVKAVLG
jgi:hypothetical protein